MGFILTINGGSSSIKFAVYEIAKPLRRVFGGQVERIGLEGTRLSARGLDGKKEERAVDAGTFERGAEVIVGFIDERLAKAPPSGEGDKSRGASLAGIGHRVVHGGIHLLDTQVIDDEVMAELRRTQPLDLAHLPRQIALIEAFRKAYPNLPEVACFDTAFHRDLPRVAQMLPIPRRYFEQGVRRFGFHGLSYTYLMGRIREIASEGAAKGRIILAHLGSGASMAAVSGGKPVDTTMAFTPTAGLVMGTRPGDIDPGLLVYMMRVEKKPAEEMDEFISHECGLAGVSGGSSDMRDLVERQENDEAARDAVNLFCYQAKKWIGAYAAAMGGLDMLVFSGGIGEHSVEARAGICAGLEFLGIRVDPKRNRGGEEIISANGGAVVVRVIPTDEEIVIAQAVYEFASKK
jgi:acetate kinase